MTTQISLKPVQALTVTIDSADNEWQILPRIAKLITPDLKAKTEMYQYLLNASVLGEMLTVKRVGLYSIKMKTKHPAITIIRLTQPVTWISAKGCLLNAVVVLQLDAEYGEHENQSITAHCCQALASAASLKTFAAFEENNPIWQA